jgi:hypothetical protein
MGIRIPRHFAAPFAVALVLLVSPRTNAARAQCDGDCNGDRRVTIDELVAGVGLALGTGGTTCAAIDRDGNGLVVISELIAAVRYALEGCPPPADYPLDDTLRLNQIQVLGSHNSYHVEADPIILQILATLSATLEMQIEYQHIPLPDQFETQGIRQIELDVWADPQGGLYASPFALRTVTEDPDARIPELDVPGFKVLHIADVDYRTTCNTLIECLTQVKGWSDAHPGHVPMMIQIEAKDDAIEIGLDFALPIPIGPAELDALDAEIRSVFPPEQLITPDDVRGTHDTLLEAIAQDGWPSLGASRGKVLFCFDNEGSYRADYIAGHAALRGRVLFTSSEPPAAEAGFIKLNDPLADFDHIKDVVAQGFIVRTRADADTVQARSGDVTMRDAAIASGAQFVSTDYPVPNPAFGTGYMVAIPGGTPARCNPISAPLACSPTDIENPAHLADR